MTSAFLRCPIRFASGAFACLLLVALISRANAETPTRLDAIIGAGVLRVGLTEDYRPFSFAAASDKVEGIDVDMAMSLAQSLGVKLDIVKTTWSTLKSDLEANGFDIAMGGVTITLDRQKVGLVSNPVFSSGKTPITHCGDEPTYHVVVAFDRDAEGDLKPGEAREVLSPIIAERRARALAVGHAGALAFSRTGDPATGEFQDAVVPAQFGEVDLDSLRE
jgi:ABC-type amino acid transport substrate-binding protein